MDYGLELINLMKSLGADLVGFADLTGLPGHTRSDLPRGVALAVGLNPRIIADISEGPTREYFEEYRRVNRLLSEMSLEAGNFIRELGYQARTFAATNEGVDRKTNSTQLPHKTVATRAGLGWIGRCALLITKEFGSAVRLNKVLTDMPLRAGDGIDASLCGECRECIDACPGKVASGKPWVAGLHRDEFYNAAECARTARDQALLKTGINETFCGICIAACPWTKDYISRQTARR